MFGTMGYWNSGLGLNHKPTSDINPCPACLCRMITFVIPNRELKEGLQ